MFSPFVVQLLHCKRQTCIIYFSDELYFVPIPVPMISAFLMSSPTTGDIPISLMLSLFWKLRERRMNVY